MTRRTPGIGSSTASGARSRFLSKGMSSLMPVTRLSGLAYHDFRRVHILPIVRMRVASVDFRLGSRSERRKKVEIATFVGLTDVFRIKCAVATRIARRRRLPGVAAAGKFLLR